MVVTNLMSYDIFVWGIILYPLGVTLDFWEETTYILPIKMTNKTQDFATSEMYSFLQNNIFTLVFFDKKYLYF
jgi:hypothetical protein